MNSNQNKSPLLATTQDLRDRRGGRLLRGLVSKKVPLVVGMSLMENSSGDLIEDDDEDEEILAALQLIIARYNENQPRVPKGSSKGGQWTKSGTTNDEYEKAISEGDTEKAEILFMDAALENPPNVPSYLQEAWEYGQATKEMSDSEAVYSGMVPDWVFDYSRETNEFYEAGRRDESPEFVVGWRRGGIPESGVSKNHASGELESGVSLAYAHKRTDMELNPLTMMGVSGRQKTFVQGWAFPKSRWGSDGEIVIIDPKEIEPIKKRDGKIIPLSERFTSKKSKVSAAAAAAEEQKKTTIENLTAQALENLTGVSYEWLKPVKPFFEHLAALSMSKQVSDQDFIEALEKAQKQIPELFDRLDTDALEAAMNDAFGTAMVAGSVAIYDPESGKKSDED